MFGNYNFGITYTSPPIYLISGFDDESGLSGFGDDPNVYDQTTSIFQSIANVFTNYYDTQKQQSQSAIAQAQNVPFNLKSVPITYWAIGGLLLWYLFKGK